MIGWIVAGLLLGMVTLLLLDSGITSGELLLVAAWPVTVPVSFVWRTWRRWRTRCPVCRRRYADRAIMLRHLERHTPDERIDQLEHQSDRMFRWYVRFLWTCGAALVVCLVGAAVTR